MSSAPIALAPCGSEDASAVGPDAPTPSAAVPHIVSTFTSSAGQICVDDTHLVVGRPIDHQIVSLVLRVIEFADVDEVVSVAIGKCCGLGDSVWTCDIARTIRPAKRIESGQVPISRYGSHGVIGVPFGGDENSAFGPTNSADAILEYIQIRAVVFKAGQELPAAHRSTRESVPVQRPARGGSGAVTLAAVP